MTAPGSVSPPLRKLSRVSGEKPPLSLPLAWHLMHAASKRGWMSWAKSTGRLAGGGSGALGAAKTERFAPIRSNRGGTSFIVVLNVNQPGAKILRAIGDFHGGG